MILSVLCGWLTIWVVDRYHRDKRARDLSALTQRLDHLEQQVANGIQAAGTACLKNSEAIQHTIAAVETLMVGLRALKQDAEESYLRKTDLN